MWLTRTSILRPVTITMAVGALIVLGLSSLSKMPVDLYPDIEFPFVSVVSVYSGAGPEEIETLVTKPIEDTVSTISGVKNVTSTSQEGLSVVSIEFYLGTSLDTAANDVREKVNVAGFELPTDMQPPVIEKFSITSMPIISFALSSPRPSKELRRIADDVIKDRLGRLKGVGSVGITGGDIREILVSVDRDQLEAYGLSIDQVVQALTMANLNLPSGNVKEGRREYAIRAVGEFNSPQEIRALQLATPSGKAISLSDVADVQDTVTERKELARVDGNDSITVTVLKQSGANTVDVSDAVRGELTKLTGQTFDYRGYEVKGAKRAKGILPSDITARITSDQSTFVKDALSDLFHHMLFGALLAVLVVFVFLHNLRGTAIVALAIPTSIIAAFTPIYFAHFTLNQMTMLAFSVSVGVLVDDSIVVIENIYRHLRLGEKPREAALNGRTEIGLAAITITLVDVVVFVPIAFMGGIVGQFFRQYGITVAMVTLFSLFIAFTLTPMISSRWYREQDAVPTDESEEQVEPGAAGGRQDRPRGLISGPVAAFFRAFDRGYGRFRSGYRKLLEWALNHRLATICIGVIALLMSIGIVLSGRALLGFQILIGLLSLLTLVFGGKGARAPALIAGVVGLLVITVFRANLGFEFFPTVDQGMINVSVELPAGASLEATDGVVRQIEQFMLDKKSFPEVDSVRATVGSGSSGAFGGGSTGASYGSLAVVLIDKLKRTRSDTDIAALIDRFAQGIPGASIKASTGGGLGGGGEAPIRIELSGTDMSEILRVAHLIEARTAKVEGTVNTDITWKVGKPEVRAQIDRYRAADRGVTTAQVARALRTSLEGDNTAKYREGSQQYDIRVRLREVDRRSVRDVGSLMVAYNHGPVYLSDVADVSPGVGPTQIDRKNRQRMVAVTADLKKGFPLGNVVQEIQKEIADIPTGSVTVYFGGESEIMMESFGYMLAALALAVVLIYILQAALFEGYLAPFVIMFGLPLALVGALLAIVITGNTLSIITMIGIIMLMGLVGKNSILLVDYTNTLRERGLSVRDALLEAGPTRLRPVIMTSLSLIFGLMPVALAKAHGAEGRSPMAVAVIGGMMFSTLLALVMIPVLYTVFDGVAAWLNGMMRKAIGFFLPVKGEGGD